ncbi:MAG: amidohydrolase family protein [Firmicutes bacterium]|nr:amidohydrolase family protein [Bacillota bacterium]MCL5038631.1 amidohydrolase family protein [Bacillota bacterium]
MDKLRVVDFHTHFPTRLREQNQGQPERGQDELRNYARQLRSRWLKEWDFQEPEKNPPADEEQAARWAQEVIANGLYQVVFVTGGGNRHLADLIKPYSDKFIGFAHHDPEKPDALERIREAVDQLGLKGYKMFGPLIKGSFDDPSWEPLWEFLAERRLPVLIHFGILGGGGGKVYHHNMSPLVIHNVARHYPEIPFVIPHFGAGYWQELLHLAWSAPNIYIDTSGSNQWMRWMPYPLDLESLFRKASETVGPERIIFGSDSSWFPRGFARRYLQDQLRVCRWLNMKEEDVRAIFGGNARRLLENIRYPGSGLPS